MPTPRGYPYPRMGDRPDVAADVTALADALDTDVGALSSHGLAVPQGPVPGSVHLYTVSAGFLDATADTAGNHDLGETALGWGSPGLITVPNVAGRLYRCEAAVWLSLPASGAPYYLQLRKADGTALDRRGGLIDSTRNTLVSYLAGTGAAAYQIKWTLYRSSTATGDPASAQSSPTDPCYFVVADAGPSAP